MSVRDKGTDPRLDDRTAPGLNRFDLAGTEIDADHVVSHVREAGSRNRAYVPKPEHANRPTHANFAISFRPADVNGISSWV